MTREELLAGDNLERCGMPYEAEVLLRFVWISCFPGDDGFEIPGFCNTAYYQTHRCTAASNTSLCGGSSLMFFFD